MLTWWVAASLRAYGQQATARCSPIKGPGPVDLGRQLASEPSVQEGARKMALLLWLCSLLGSACLVSANIFGEF